ncbi:MAG: ABC transporter ATPase [Pyrinomonadaceae bacterium]|nr:ABC transporter ATPase [Sphingobacteriaceae bacterium]
MEISKNSRVWIYQSNRPFNTQEQEAILSILQGFTTTWEAHGSKLAAQAEIRYDRFIILMVDESQAGASGCSIDKSVSLMKEIEVKYKVSLFDRFNIAWRNNDAIFSCNRDEFETRISKGEITPNTIVFNNLVQTVQELDINWEIPFKNSWHSSVFGSFINA